MQQRQFSAAFRSLACQSRTSVPTRARRSTLPATQVVRKRTQLALGATHVGGSPPTSAQGRSSKPDATFHPARWAGQAEKRIFHDPPRLPRDRHRPSAVQSAPGHHRQLSLHHCRLHCFEASLRELTFCAEADGSRDLIHATSEAGSQAMRFRRVISLARDRWSFALALCHLWFRCWHNRGAHRAQNHSAAKPRPWAFFGVVPHMAVFNGSFHNQPISMVIGHSPQK